MFNPLTVFFDLVTQHPANTCSAACVRPTTAYNSECGWAPILAARGHDFHLKFFLGGHCPHCDPQFLLGGKRPYELYTDAKFSDGTAVSQRGDDGKMIERTTQFIPGNVSDHELFGKGNEAYKSNLRLQRASTAAALLAGRWSVFEGQYFSCWEENRGVVEGVDGTRTIPQPDMRMVVPRKEIQIEHWYPHFTGTDYGFTISAAASYLFVRVPKSEFWPNGRVYVLDEVVRQGILAEDLARLLLQRWFLEEIMPGKWQVPARPKAIMMWALSPDAWAKSGVKGDQDVPLTRADQMNAILGPYRMGFIQANNDRQGRWQHIYRGLRSGDTCPMLIEAIPSLIHDPDKEDDIFKQKGSPLDDAIDAAGYGYYTWTREPVKPIDLQRAEIMQGLDPTSAMINKARFDAQQRPRNAPVFIGPGGAAPQDVGGGTQEPAAMNGRVGMSFKPSPFTVLCRSTKGVAVCPKARAFASDECYQHEDGLRDLLHADEQVSWSWVWGRERRAGLCLSSFFFVASTFSQPDRLPTPPQDPFGWK